MYIRFFKPFFDIIFALLMLFVLLPVFVAVFFVLLFVNKGKVFFVQVRPGHQGKPFKIFKFRTLKDSAGTDEERATPIGKFLRKTYLDELPQILNILKGEMSWIGPRPLLMEYLQSYTPQEQERHQVKPGITGLAQLRASKDSPLKEKLIWDLLYVQNISLALDAKILKETLSFLLSRE